MNSSDAQQRGGGLGVHVGVMSTVANTAAAVKYVGLVPISVIIPRYGIVYLFFKTAFRD